MIIAVTNKKGGVGKTTITANVAAALARLASKPRVLAIDLDSQYDLSKSLGIAPAYQAEHPTIYDVLVDLDQTPLEKARITLPAAGFDLVPGSQRMAALAVDVGDVVDKHQRLQFALEELHDHYDYILLDCSPSVELQTVNAWVAATAALIPTQPEPLSYTDTSMTITDLRLIDKRLRRKPATPVYIVINQVETRPNKLHPDYVEKIRSDYSAAGAVVLETVIPRRMAQAEAIEAGMTMFEYSRPHAQVYLKIAQELEVHLNATSTKH